MALPRSSVDDRDYAQLLDLLRKHLPVDRWVDHNPSDSGIALLELLVWLGDMSLYRMDRESDAHRQRYLELILTPPEPATALVKFTLSPARALGNDYTIPVGTLLATDYRNGERMVYQTTQDLRLRAPAIATDPQEGWVLAREFADVTNEELGKSNGKPNQVFPLRARGNGRHVLLDFSRSYPLGADPNPQLTVDGTAWTLRPFLRTDASRGLVQHFMVDPLRNEVRFGDGVSFGAIPPVDKPIVATRYQVIAGPEAYIDDDQLQHILAPLPPLATTEVLQLRNRASQDGAGVFAEGEERHDAGLRALRERDRLVIRADFQTVLRTQFRDFQDAFRKRGISARFLARVDVLMNREAGDLFTERRGHVTVIVVPEPKLLSWDAFAASSLATAQAEITVDEPLQTKILGFLERRRLITTRVYVLGALLNAISIEVTVTAAREWSVDQVQRDVERRLRSFLRINDGYLDGRGWPIGRAVHPSELFRLLEALPGVDHVPVLRLNGAEAPVSLGPQGLPFVTALAVGVEQL